MSLISLLPIPAPIGLQLPPAPKPVVTPKPVASVEATKSIAEFLTIPPQSLPKSPSETLARLAANDAGISFILSTGGTVEDCLQYLYARNEYLNKRVRELLQKNGQS